MQSPQSKSEQWLGIAIATVILIVAIAASAYAQSRQQVAAVAFTASWCAQCQLDKPYYPQLKARYGTLVVIDYDANPDVAKQWGVKSLPTYVVVVNGKVAAATQKIKELL